MDFAGRYQRVRSIWNMGCIILEWIIYLLYGYEELRSFSQSLRDHGSPDSFYFVVDSAGKAANHQAEGNEEYLYAARLGNPSRLGPSAVQEFCTPSFADIEGISALQGGRSI
ncbi:serine threonine kinase [Fusarium albosuccineum]|uniref:Serine threonine kinase n=1 Tax=Fusarium albosuccineum TaxID=1237068 RepID=A0A8H4PAU7_9HYPO|nr:serine threonine kinase [Fusarium albosuccineum]